MTMQGLKNRAPDERIDVNRTLDTHGHNVPGHDARMDALAAKVQKEYFETGLHKKETTGKHSEKG